MKLVEAGTFGAAAFIATTLAVVLVWYVCYVVLPRLEEQCSGVVFTKDAKRRATALFLSKLTPAQRRAWYLRRQFSVQGKSGQSYTVSTYGAFNIRTWDAVFCVDVGGVMPAHDKLLAQKLLIECDEALFLATANVRTASLKWQRLIDLARADCRRRGLSAGPLERAA